MMPLRVRQVVVHFRRDQVQMDSNLLGLVVAGMRKLASVGSLHVGLELVTASLSAVPLTPLSPRPSSGRQRTHRRSRLMDDVLGIVAANGSRLVTPTQTAT